MCVLLSDGSVQCLGSNTDSLSNIKNQLGNLNAGYGTMALVNVSGLSAQASVVTAGGMSTCALLVSGRVQCWGANSYGQLGDSTTSDRLFGPVFVSGLESVVALATGWDHTCAIVSNGAIMCWGGNFYGQVGVLPPGGTTVPVLTPQLVPGLKISCA